MEFLNSNKWIMFFSIMLISLIQPNPEIDLEKVKADFIAMEGHGIPEEHINRRNAPFQVFYTHNKCFVHLQYKYYLSEPYMKPSAVAIYYLVNDQWKLEKILPYYYDVILTDPLSQVFSSNNLFCEPTGACASYLEISAYQDGEFESIVHYAGFNKVLYYNYALGLNEVETVSKVIGDTIANEYFISDIKVESSKIAFKLVQKISMLKSVNDTLNINRSVLSTFVRKDF